MLIQSLARVGQGRESLRRAEDLIVKARSLATQTGSSPEMLRRELPRAHTAMGAACRALGKRGEAGNWYRTAVGEWQALLAAGFSSPETLLAAEAKIAERQTRGASE
jgi:hypothetical protein